MDKVIKMNYLSLKEGKECPKLLMNTPMRAHLQVSSQKAEVAVHSLQDNQIEVQQDPHLGVTLDQMKWLLSETLQLFKTL